MPNSRSTKGVAATIGVLVLNFALYVFGFLLAARFIFGALSRPFWMCAFFLAVGALSRFWSKTWWLVVVPAAAGFLWGLGALKWAIHLTDTLGEYAPPMAHYVFSPSFSEVSWGIAAGAAAGIGWWLAMRLLPGDMSSVETHI
jgi:hypothetical protein